ncbi:MAG: hypothetical protein HRU19_19155 [Pseudobacteriovorax sp.]|nr:hypothetical protein [Pseudobacteriovorax sp.]
MKKFLTILALGSSVLLTSHASATSLRDKRSLVIVSHLDTNPGSKWAWLYSFLDSSTVTLAEKALKNRYKSISLIEGSHATKGKFISTLKGLAEKPGIKAVDTILSVHGLEGKVEFEDGMKSVSSIRNQLRTSPHRRKFRLMYNLACFGASHRSAWRSSGFRTASGSKGVNTSSATEYPLFLKNWSSGGTLGSVFDLHNGSIAMQISDSIAINMGFPKADSYKLVSGHRKITINSSAN